MENNTNSSTDNKKKWLQRLFYNRICAQIRQLEKEESEYLALKSTVQNLVSDLNTCKTSFSKIYSLACAGISYPEITASISKINSYSVDVGKKIESLTSVISDIDKEIKEIRTKISSLRSQI